MKRCKTLTCSMIAGSALLAGCATTGSSKENWVVDTQEQWQQADAQSNLEFKKGFASPTAQKATYRSKVRKFDKKVSAQSILFEQDPVWENWTETPRVSPVNLGDAPVLLSIGPDNYWMFGRYMGVRNAKNFVAKPAKLEGFDVPLMTTPFKNQYNAPGGLVKGKGGYHAWQSRDMKNWVHHGAVSEKFSQWVTTAEYKDGKLYLYYDYPNDMDPHLYIDDDLFDGEPGRNLGRAFDDPSLGSDCSVIRDEKGDFHIISEDWSPIHAGRHSWDSPLASHAVSKDGIKNFKMKKPAIDHRTTPTGKYETYKLHPNQNPDSYPDCPFPARFPASEYKIATYEVHEPEQPAYGDWAAISIGGQYYLFADYHPANEKIRVAWFTSSSIDEPFTFCGELGRGHPDPDIGFAEGRFYLVTQLKNDYVSSGPWVDKVEARVGVDTDKDGSIDTWTDWQEVKESYDYVEGFSKQVQRVPASMDLRQLPAGYGFCFEFRTEDTTENKSKPILDSVTMSFK